MKLRIVGAVAGLVLAASAISPAAAFRGDLPPVTPPNPPANDDCGRGGRGPCLPPPPPVTVTPPTCDGYGRHC